MRLSTLDEFLQEGVEKQVGKNIVVVVVDELNNIVGTSKPDINTIDGKVALINVANCTFAPVSAAARAIQKNGRIFGCRF